MSFLWEKNKSISLWSDSLEQFTFSYRRNLIKKEFLDKDKILFTDYKLSIKLTSDQYK